MRSHVRRQMDICESVIYHYVFSLVYLLFELQWKNIYIYIVNLETIVGSSIWCSYWPRYKFGSKFLACLLLKIWCTPVSAVFSCYKSSLLNRFCIWKISVSFQSSHWCGCSWLCQGNFPTSVKWLSWCLPVPYQRKLSSIHNHCTLYLLQISWLPSNSVSSLPEFFSWTLVSCTKIVYSIKLHAATFFPRKSFFLIFGNTVILGLSWNSGLCFW